MGKEFYAIDERGSTELAAKVDKETYTVDQFCDAHQISRVTFYRLRWANRGPREMRVGTRVLVSREAAAAWRSAMEGAPIKLPQRRERRHG